MLNKMLLSVVMLTVIFGCANQQKEEAEQPTENAEVAISVPTEEISLNVTGMV